MRSATPAARIQPLGRTGPKPTAIRTGRRSTTKPAELLSRTRTPAAIAGDRSISLFTKSRSNARSRPTQHGTAGTHRPGNRCLRASGTKSALSPSTNHLVQEPTRPNLQRSHVGPRTVSFRMDQGPEAARRSQATAIPARSGRFRTQRWRATSIQLVSRTGSLRFRWSCTPVPTIFVMSRSAAADRN